MICLSVVETCYLAAGPVLSCSKSSQSCSRVSWSYLNIDQFNRYSYLWTIFVKSYSILIEQSRDQLLIIVINIDWKRTVSSFLHRSIESDENRQHSSSTHLRLIPIALNIPIWSRYKHPESNSNPSSSLQIHTYPYQCTRDDAYSEYKPVWPMKRWYFFWFQVS